MMEAFRELFYAGRGAIRPLSDEAARVGLMCGWVERENDKTWQGGRWVEEVLGYSMTERGRRAYKAWTAQHARPIADMLADAGIVEAQAVKRLMRRTKAQPSARRVFPEVREGETTQSYIRRYYAANNLPYVGGPQGYSYSGDAPC